MKHSAALSALAYNQKLPQVVLTKMAHTLLAHFDMCKRGVGDNYSANIVSLHIVIALNIGSIKKNKAWYECASRAFSAFNKACGRPDPVSLTTGEYTAIRSCLGPYLSHVLPRTNWKEYLMAEKHAFLSFDIDEETQQEFIEYSRVIEE